ncbi:hypothetical protein Q31a_54170 [Aureliella helgolandensis]|uniref:Uncharacterized protein n=1 Tax=Aureliella helgolandensis TaxID=2527968 RepID=A0A518GEL1_9BACT|nr:hypothetical protein Q31a_54170 [Aureliella helgolandensis]
MEMPHASQSAARIAEIVSLRISGSSKYPTGKLLFKRPLPIQRTFRSTGSRSSQPPPLSAPTDRRRVGMPGLISHFRATTLVHDAVAR